MMPLVSFEAIKRCDNLLLDNFKDLHLAQRHPVDHLSEVFAQALSSNGQLIQSILHCMTMVAELELMKPVGK